MGGSRGTGRRRSAVVFAVEIFGLALLGYGLLMFVAQRRLVFPGVSRAPARPSATAPAGVTQVWLEASFGRVEAWFFRARGGGSGPTVVFAHGNGELIDDWQREMEDLRAEGVSVLLVEFPGYGFSDGSPSRETLRETFSRAYDWLVERSGVATDRIVAYGRSLGGGAAADLTRDRRVRGLVLQSTFTSAAAMARSMLLPGFLVRDRFDNRRAVADFQGPILLMHGVADDVIPYAHAEGLARARDGLAVTVLECAHNDCASQWPVILGALTGFIAEHGLFDARAQGETR